MRDSYFTTATVKARWKIVDFQNDDDIFAIIDMHTLVHLFALVLTVLCVLTTTVNCTAASPDATPSIDVAVNTSGVPTLEECVFSNDVSVESLEVVAGMEQRCKVATHFDHSSSERSTDDIVAPNTGPEELGTKEELQAIQDAVREVLPSTQRNFALEKDGAKVLAANPGAKKPSGVLDDDSDTFMRNDCRDDKWLVIELSQVAKISRIDIAQYELYSSRLKEFEVRGRQSHPRTDDVDTAKGLNSTAWKVLGRWTAERVKGTQEFMVDNPPWVRFLLFRFLSHYGSEPVCAVNGIAVYGKSAAEELEAQLAQDGPLEGWEEVDAEASPKPSDQHSEHEPANSTDSKDNVAADHDALQHDQLTSSKQEEPSLLHHGEGGDLHFKPARPTNKGNSTAITSIATLDAQNESTVVDHKKSNASKSDHDTGLFQKRSDGSPTEKVVAHSSISKDRGDLGIALDVDASAGGSQNDTPSVQNETNTTEQGNIADLLEEVPVPKAKAGSGMYEVLVQEIRASRAQQRLMAKALDALQRNLTLLANELERSRKDQEEMEMDASMKIESLIAARVGTTHVEIKKLQRALKASAHREVAGWALLAMVCSSLILNVFQNSRSSGRSLWLHYLVILLLAVHSLVIVLYLHSSIGLWSRPWGGRTILALPGPPAIVNS